MYQNYDDGGIRMANYTLFVKTQRIMWLKRLIYGGKINSWKLYFDYSCESIRGRLVFLCDYEISIMNLKIPHLCLEMLRAWQEIRKCRFSNIESFNPIIFKDNIICVESLYEKGIYLVNHLLDKGRLRPIEHFQNLGVNSKEAFIILTRAPGCLTLT